MEIYLDTLALIGLTITVSFGVGQLLKRIGIPQVVGFLFAGLLLGPSFLHLIPDELNQNLGFISEIALGLIGFEMGSHLRLEELRKLGKSIFWITLLQAFGAFLLVGIAVYLITGSDYMALLFAALATTTAPAATMDVLTEYKASGSMTTTLLAVIGIDDALALLLFSFAAAVAELLMIGGDLSLIEMIKLPLFEIGGSLIVGIIIGWLMALILKRLPLRYDAVALPIGISLFAAGLATTLHLSLILVTMTMGTTVVNVDRKHGDYIRYIIEQAAPVVYILFFALAGARMHIDLLPSMGLLGAAYVILRAIGKYGGAWLGGWFSGASKPVRNYLGLALLTQAGVAIGLALESQRRFSALGEEGVVLGTLILNVITATMLIHEILGPLGVKVAVIRAGEAGKAVATPEPEAAHAESAA